VIHAAFIVLKMAPLLNDFEGENEMKPNLIEPWSAQTSRPKVKAHTMTARAVLLFSVLTCLSCSALAESPASESTRSLAPVKTHQHHVAKEHFGEGDRDVEFHFSTFGDSRTDRKIKSITAQDKLFLTATAPLARMIKELNAKKSQALFFNGDMIMGYDADSTQVQREYAYWRGMMATLMESGTYVVPVPGNHEVQMPTKGSDGQVVKYAQTQLENIWRENMSDLILDEARWNHIVKTPFSAFDIHNTPLTSEDHLQTDQTQLYYSFDVGHLHIAVINTDPVGADASVAVNWLKRDFEAAKERGANAIVAFGHKMPFVYIPDGSTKASEDSLDNTSGQRDAFWSVMESYGATYFCGHEHVFHADQPTKAAGGQSWQVIVGSGGSPFGIKKGESKNPQDRMYAWADVKVHKSGALGVKIFGFDENMGPTQELSHWRIEPSNRLWSQVKSSAH